MNLILQFFIWIPLLGLLGSILISYKHEKYMALLTQGTVGLHLILFVFFTAYWMYAGFPFVNYKELVLYQTKDYEFYIDFCFDKVTATYLFVGAYLTFLVSVYSRYYMHREHGYKRFFSSILFFYVGYNFVVLSGNLETLFVGWEILGITSFLLIAFYRDRYLPVKNALKVYSVYRIGDVGLILAMWMSHHLWHENITFYKLSNADLVHHQLEYHTWIGVFISLMILISAAAKSAQWPFSSWLSRAMEGPTPSSAIFYGSLSVHIGIFLLLRTYPLWENQLSVRILIGVLGVFTSVLATGIAKVQSSVKSQIAYASIVQIGLIFLELALGFRDLALFHFAGNAFLRTYQLLVSPSVVSYLIQEQLYNYQARKDTVEDSFPMRMQYTLYMLCLKEWNLDAMLYQLMWSPIKWLGVKVGFISLRKVLIVFVLAFLLAYIAYWFQDSIPRSIHRFLPGLFGVIGLLMVLKSFTERRSPLVSFLLVLMNHVWIDLAVSFNEHFDQTDSLIYLSGVLLSASLGVFVLLRLRKLEPNLSLNQFQGHVYEHPRLAFLFLMACLGISGFPITPTFIGVDLIFSHIHEDQLFLAFLSALSFIVDGLAILRIYARVFLGPHIKNYHEVAHRAA